MEQWYSYSTKTSILSGKSELYKDRQMDVCTNRLVHGNWRLGKSFTVSFFFRVQYQARGRIAGTGAGDQGAKKRRISFVVSYTNAAQVKNIARMV
jgi:hypothetical protein